MYPGKNYRAGARDGRLVHSVNGVRMAAVNRGSRHRLALDSQERVMARMPQEPDYGDEPLPPPTEEEQRGDAWEYWHERATKLEAALHGMLLHFGNPKRDEWLNDEAFRQAKEADALAREALKRT